MKLTRMVAILFTLVVVAFGAVSGGDETPRIVEKMKVEGDIPRFTKVLVLGITEDPAVRRGFEDRFVSILKGRRVDGLPSWKVSEGLGEVPDKEKILLALTGSGIDAVLTVRPVPLGKDEPEETWATAWKASWEKPMTIRQLIDETLPLPEQKKVKRAGVEIAVWEVATRGRLWTGRTGVHSPRQIREAVPDLVQQTIDALMDAGAI